LVEKLIEEKFPINGIDLLECSISKEKNIVLTIAKKGGVSVEDCESVSRALFEEIPDEYSLQVQSPGLDYKFKFEDYEYFLEQKIRVKYNGGAKNIKVDGIFKSYNGEVVIVHKNGKDIPISKESIIQIKTTI